MIKRAFGYVGNRGIVLGMLGLIWSLTAVGVAVDPVRDPGLLHTQLPNPVSYALWAIPGFVAVLSVAVRRLDAWAWALLIAPVAVRFLSYLTGFAFNTYPDGWRGAAVYMGTAVLINRCAAGLDRPAPWDGRERRLWTNQ